VLDLQSTGAYDINGTVLPKAELGARLAQIFRDRPVKLLYIRAGAGWKYREVVEAADIARGAGVQVIGYVPTTP
jgi:biopolymer transport protein ExbD